MTGLLETKYNVISDGKKNSIILVTGILSKNKLEEEITIPLKSLDETPDYIKIDLLTFAIQSGILCTLWWENDFDNEFILPLEGRGFLNFTSFGGLQNPKSEGHTGCLVIKINKIDQQQEGHFMLLLDLTKVGK